MTINATSSGGGGGGALTAPSNLSGYVTRSTGAVNLSWTDNSSNEDGFYLKRAPAGTSNFTRIGQVPAKVAWFLDTPGGGRWTYRVQAFNSSAASGYSNEVTFRVK